MIGDARTVLERRLQEERGRALRSLRGVEEEERISQREASGEVARVPSSLADQGSDTQEEEKDFIVATRESDRLARIDAALKLLYRDPERYGRCERCGEPIEVERLELVPWTRLCARCAREAEASE
ncbi:MAG: TraR/DksA C4-type zinc finger protein [Gemmatimonadetes bacterium]|nr:TraR/DksA C4-type zinc finger protein [Gemmatimonadota bacterium]